MSKPSPNAFASFNDYCRAMDEWTASAWRALDDELDPSPYCSYGHKTQASCDCGPIASNE